MRARAALYLRISREDGDGSQSIENQKEFLLSYAAEQGFWVYDIYSDDGYSGTNFNRPGFKRMLRDIEAGRLDIVITKDLSRLGRDYIGTGEYIEKYFPSKNIRYIAVNDNVDTGRGLEKTAPFMYVFNDFYPRDISDKVKAVFTHKKLAGEFIGSFAPYGYKKHPDIKGKLIVNEETAPVVRRIFGLFLSGCSVSDIAARLTEERIMTPSQYSGRISSRQKNQGIWNAAMIKRILTNPTYAGHLTQNRSRKLGVKLNKQIILPPKQWITVRDTHEPIISQEDFEKAGELLAVKSRRQRKKEGHILTGLVFCGSCGSKMTFQRDGEGRRYLICSLSRKKVGDMPAPCSSHCIREDAVEEAVFEGLQRLFKGRISGSEIDKIISQTCRPDASSNKRIKELKRRIGDIARVKYRLYTDLVCEKLSYADYEALNGQAQDEQRRLECELERLEDSSNLAANRNELRELLIKAADMKSPDRAALIWFVEGIYIGNDKSIEIRFKFMEPAPNKSEAHGNPSC
ncbi:MAG: recombinase family protein [Clostridiales bacterium]|jgi:DNA invertase Pin-like site-specific DNA recombinase|nr:recombinase family protein [Clostridiales bacterium]